MAQPQDYEWFFDFGPEAGAGGEAGCADFGSDYPKLEGRLSTPTATGYTMSVNEGGGAVVVTVLAANSHYYPTSDTGGMLAAIGAALTANGSLAGTYSLILDDTDNGTGRVTISATGVASFAITWPDETLRDALGFTGSVSGAATYISPSACPYVWLPDRRRVDPPTPEGMKGFPVPRTIVTRSNSASKALSLGFNYDSKLQFRLMRGNKVWRCFEQVTNESLENFYELIIGRGVPVRYHTDRANDTRYVDWRIMPTWAVRPEVPAYVGRGCVGADSLWAYGEVDVMEYVP